MNHVHPAKIHLTAHRKLPTMPTSLPADCQIPCSACSHAKIHPALHPRKTHTYVPGTYVSSDTFGPVKPTSRHGNNHILIIICAASRFTMAHFIKEQKDIPAYVSQTLDYIRNRMHHPVTDFQTDNAKEYTSSIIQAIYRDDQVQHHLRTPHQSQQNCIAERFNGTIMNAVRSLLDTAGLADTYWEDAARDAIFKYNLIDHTAIDISQYAKWYGRIPAIQKLFTPAARIHIEVCTKKET